MAQVHAEGRPSKLTRAERPTRTPINGIRDILNVKGKEDGWHYCWVNEDNVDRYIEGGYFWVDHDVIVGDKRLSAASMGSKISKPVGNGVTAFLLRCPDEIYDDEIARIEEATAATEDSLKQSTNKSDGQYGNVSISRKRVV
jgi:hypothetical protein